MWSLINSHALTPSGEVELDGASWIPFELSAIVGGMADPTPPEVVIEPPGTALVNHGSRSQKRGRVERSTHPLWMGWLPINWSRRLCPLSSANA